MKNEKKNIALALLAMAAIAANAQDRQVLTLGYANTPLLQAAKGGRASLDGRALLKSKDSKAGSRMAKADLRTVDWVAANLAEIDPTPEDRDIITAAKEAGVPVVIENADEAKMSALFGIGVKASLLVADFDPRTKRTNITLADPMPMEEVPGYVQMPGKYENFGDRV